MNYQNDREQQNLLLRRQENELHSLQLQDSKIKMQMQEQTTLDEKLMSVRQELADSIERLKVGVLEGNGYSSSKSRF